MLMKSKEGNVSIFCDCGCNEGMVFNFSRFGDDISISAIDDFHVRTAELSHFKLFREKAKMIFKIITGRDVYCTEILLSKEEYAEFYKDLGEINKILLDKTK